MRKRKQSVVFGIRSQSESTSGRMGLNGRTQFQDSGMLWKCTCRWYVKDCMWWWMRGEEQEVRELKGMEEGWGWGECDRAFFHESLLKAPGWGSGGAGGRRGAG